MQLSPFPSLLLLQEGVGKEKGKMDEAPSPSPSWIPYLDTFLPIVPYLCLHLATLSVKRIDKKEQFIGNKIDRRNVENVRYASHEGHPGSSEGQRPVRHMSRAVLLMRNLSHSQNRNWQSG